LVNDTGYYCTGGSEEPEPVGKDYGNTCTAGHYCPNGTHTPVPCPPGTYLTSTGIGSVDDCTPCSPGEASFQLFYGQYVMTEITK